MTPRRTSRLAPFAATALLSCALAVVACSRRSGDPANPNPPQGPGAGEGTTLPEGGVFRRADLLAAIADCALANAREFEGKARALRDAVVAYDTAPSETGKAAARDAWSAAIAVWQRLEVFQFGPAAMSSQPGGKELRESIYSWPLGGRCLVEQALVAERYAQPTFADDLVSTRGLLAMEYLLFYEAGDNGCSPSASINTNGTWAALGDAEVQRRKRAYAKAAAEDVVRRAGALVAAWDPSGENFRAELVNAGRGSKTYATDQMAFNAVSDAMFYVEFDVKDMKLARPAGLAKCTTATCPEALESLYAKQSLEHVKNNLRGFRQLYAGCGADFSGLGFADLLTAVGSGALADEIDRNVVEAVAYADAMPEQNLEAALASNPDSVRGLHAAVKKVTDRLKTEFISILDLEIPKRVEGDND
jgi:predicted lipoprotein